MEYWDGRVDTKYQQRRYVYRSVKRIFDFVASLIGLVLLSPLWLRPFLTGCHTCLTERHKTSNNIAS